MDRILVQDRLNASMHFLSDYQKNFNITKSIPIQTEMMNFIEAETNLANRRTEVIDVKMQRTKEVSSTVAAMLEDMHTFGHYKNLFLHPTGERAYSHSTLFPALQDLPSETAYWPSGNAEKILNIYFFVPPFEETEFGE